MPDQNPFSVPKPEITPESIREKMKDPKFLPSRDEFLKACIDSDTNVYSDVQFGELMSVDGPYKHQYEVLTKEFIDIFSEHLSEKIVELYKEKNEPVTVLEVGAGSGRFSYFIKKSLDSKIPGKSNVIATDSGTWGIQSVLPVEILDHRQALEKYKPDIVFASFIPSHGEDWTIDFANAPSVKEYIVVGGHQPLSHVDFDGRHLDDVEQTQICLHDQQLNREYPSESKTVSHQRGKKLNITFTKKS